MKFYNGVDIEDFINFITNLDFKATVWFNNSKGFDNHYLLPALRRMGFREVVPYNIDDIRGEMDESDYLTLKELKIARMEKLAKIYEDDYEKVYKNWNKLLEGEYSYICNKNTQIFQVNIATKTYQSNGLPYKISICDSLLIFPISVAKMGKMLCDEEIKRGVDKEVAKDKFLKKSEEKGTYKMYTYFKNIKDFNEYNNGIEKKYLNQDVYILMKFQQWMFHLFENIGEILNIPNLKGIPRGKIKMTIASTAYAEIKRILGEKILNNYISIFKIKKTKLKNGAYGYVYKNRLYKPNSYKWLMDKLFQEFLPCDWMDEELEIDNEVMTIHRWVYEWYNGGITHINEKYRYQVLSKVWVFDINSSYPYQMSKDIQVPIGYPVFGEEEGYNFKLYEITVKNEIFNEKGLPFVFVKGAKRREYVRRLTEGDVIQINSLEYENFKKYYSNKEDEDYEIECVMSFKTASMKDIFGEFIDKWYPLKALAKADNLEGLALIIKLMCNSGYGKLATKQDLVSKIMVNTDEGLKWVKTEKRQDSKYYLPLALCITSLARMDLVNAIGFNYDRFIYCDTDSLFIINYEAIDFPNIRIDKAKLGYWDLEARLDFFIARRPKQYFGIYNKYDKDNNYWKTEVKMAFAGINAEREEDENEEMEDRYDKIKYTLSFDDFIFGKVVRNQSAIRTIYEYGRVIDKVEKQIKPAWDYEPLNQQIICSMDEVLKVYIRSLEDLGENKLKYMNYLLTNMSS